MHTFYYLYYKYSSGRAIKFKNKKPPQKNLRRIPYPTSDVEHQNYFFRCRKSPGIVHVIGIPVLQIIEVCYSTEIIEVHVV